MSKKCNNCRYSNTDLANYCGSCGSSFEEYRLTKVETSLAPLYEGNSINTWVERVIQTHYDSMESTLKDYPIWEPFGKHIAAHIARIRAREFSERLVKISEQGLERLAHQQIDSALQIERSKVESQIKRQKLAEDMKLFVDAMDELKNELLQPPFDDLNEEAKTQIAERLFDELLYRVFGNNREAAMMASSLNVIDSRVN